MDHMQTVQSCEISGIRLQQIVEDRELREAGVLWPVTTDVAAVLMDEFPDEQLQGKRVLELGAGTGALGIAAAALGARVTLTDLAAVVPLTTQNVKLNSGTLARGGSAVVKVHCWGESTAELEPPFDVILACETLYWGGWDLFQDDTREGQFKTLLSCSKLDTKIIVGFTIRDKQREVGFLLEHCGKDFACRLSPRMTSTLEDLQDGDVCLVILQPHK